MVSMTRPDHFTRRTASSGCICWFRMRETPGDKPVGAPAQLQYDWSPENLLQIPAGEIYRMSLLMKEFVRDDMRDARDEELAAEDAERIAKNEAASKAQLKDGGVLEGVGISEKLKREMKGGALGIALSEGVDAGIDALLLTPEEAAAKKRAEAEAEEEAAAKKHAEAQ